MLNESVCPYHPGNLIIGYCYRCKRPVCKLCGVKIDEKELLRERFHLARYQRVEELLKAVGVKTNLYICKECLKTKPGSLTRNLIYIGSGVSVFLLGLFFELLFLALIGGIVLIVGLYDLIAS
ncbi:MAG: hypothetical protein OdinLCB4_001590 [Candidatus Odinarchaeum yellowstonii]|uniref:B box-type domain-containing protein n=1 Tax=Odinarchaeota yellowstonii (strain LCB_4) TaxID=1841599 RepID=A0AAF0D2V1_ODILC|nr:MAG: hypothetical protein OdinLCB4_001590 [Candidatus Odinarchaeum yellowstonii]